MDDASSRLKSQRGHIENLGGPVLAKYADAFDVPLQLPEELALVLDCPADANPDLQFSYFVFHRFLVG